MYHDQLPAIRDRAPIRTVAARTLLAAALMLATASQAQSAWPDRPVKIVNPFAAGSASDVVARVLADKLSPRLGQPVIVENKPGANAIIGTELVARALPDGYTYLAGGTTTHAGNPALFKSLPYDPVKDFAPVAYINGLEYFMVVPASLPAGTVQEFIAYGRANPDKLNYGAGNASGTIGAELFKSATGLDMTQINFKGPPLAVTELVAGRLSVMFLDAGTAGPFIRDGRIRALAIAASKRSANYPDVPTLAEAGVAGIDLTVWNGVWAPAGTPAPIVDRMNREINAVLATPEIINRIKELGFTTSGGPGSSPADLGRYTASQIETWARLVREANIPKQ